MNYRYGVFSFFLLTAVLCFAEDTVHVVAKGETVYSISRSFGLSQEELMRYNNIADASRLQAGARLRIPQGGAAESRGAAPASLTPSSSYAEYRVARNDTLYGIARANGVSLEVLRNANGFSAGRLLKAGELIRIPRPSGTVTAQGGGAELRAAEGEKPAAGPSSAGTAAAPRATASRTVDTRLNWPVRPRESAYMSGKLLGVVLTGERSEAVRSLTQGTVVSAGPYRGFGKVAIVEVTGGYLYVYGGCESLSVKEGDRVGPGMELGKLGIDALSEKPQLFFLVYRSNTPIDPARAPRA
ncbi:MAG: M23 family metallopeptidase [Treponema sp.]|jgi:murein DD-endopeptidase MepM/ murein hydrolase activator NlpD|nr:M23 family metallopeptidase [Treponema sp.]